MLAAPTLMELLTQKNNALNSIASLSKEVPAGKKISPFDQAKKPIDAAFRAAKRQLEADKPQTARKKRESHFPFKKNMGKYTNFAAFVDKDWGTAKDELLAAVRLTPSTGLDKDQDVGGSGCEGSVPESTPILVSTRRRASTSSASTRSRREASTSLWSRPTTTTSTRTQNCQAPSSTAR